MISWFIGWMIDACVILCLSLKTVIFYCLVLYYNERTISPLEDCRSLGDMIYFSIFMVFAIGVGLVVSN